MPEKTSIRPNAGKSGRVYSLLVNFNNPTDTIACLKSLSALTYREHSVVVVDNGSGPDSTKALIKATCAEISEKFEDAERFEGRLPGISRNNNQPVTILASATNRGFTGGNNLGMRYALEQDDAEYVWLLNNDTEVAPNALAELVDAQKNAVRDGTGEVLWGSTIVDFEDRQTIQAYGGGTVSKWTGRINHSLRGKQLSALNGIGDQYAPDYITGCSAFISTTDLRTHGLLDDDYFLYWEDTEWSFRCKRRGNAIGVAKRSLVFHRKGSTSKKYPMVGYFDTRNCLRFMSDYFPRFLLPNLVFRLLLVILLAVKHRNWPLLRASLRGYAAFLKEKLGGTKDSAII